MIFQFEHLSLWDKSESGAVDLVTFKATAVKTINGAIGVDVNGKPVQSVLELAKESGRSTGLVTTAQVTDATPAAFGAHCMFRFCLV